MNKFRTISVCGFNVEIHRFGNKTFYYPTFNGNAEFKCNSKGFRELSSYLRSVLYFNNIVKECEKSIFNT